MVRTKNAKRSGVVNNKETIKKQRSSSSTSSSSTIIEDDTPGMETPASPNQPKIFQFDHAAIEAVMNGAQPNAANCDGDLEIVEEIPEKDNDDVFADDKEFFTENGYLQATDEIRCTIVKEDGILGLEIARFSDNRRIGMGMSVEEHGIATLLASRDVIDRMISIQNMNIPGWSKLKHLGYNWYLRCGTHADLPGINLRQHFVANDLQLVPRRIGIYLRPEEITGVFNALYKIKTFDEDVNNAVTHKHNIQGEFLTCPCCSWENLEKDRVIAKKAKQPSKTLFGLK